MSPTFALRGIPNLAPGDHLCCLYETEEEHRAVLTPFLRRGLERGEKVLYFVDARTAEAVLTYLREDGLEVEPYLARGQLCILTRDDAYMRQGVFDPDGMIALVRSETARALAEGYTALRTSGEMTWALRGLPGSGRLIEYEAKLNNFFPGSQCLGLCQYDCRRFDPAVLLEVLATHPTAVVGTAVYDNFYYLPPQEIQGADRPAATLRHWVENLAARKRTEEALRKSEERFRIIGRATNDAVWDWDLLGNEVWWNEGVRALFGYSAGEVGSDVTWRYEHIHPQEREKVVSGIHAVIEGGGQCWSEEYRYRRADGAYLCVFDRGYVIHDDKGKPVRMIGAMMDITERKRAEEALRLRTEQLEAVRSVTAEISRELDLAALLELINRRAGELVGAVTGTVRLWDEQAELLIPVAWHGLGEWMKDQCRRLGEGVSGTIAQRREGMIVNDYPMSPYAHPATLERADIAAVLGEPLIYRDRLLGVLTVDKRDPGGYFTEGEQEIFCLFATQAAIAIENARLFEQVRDGRERLQSLSRQLVEVQEAERRNIARELHDEIGQLLTGLKLLLEMSARVRPEKVKARLSEAQALANELMARVRELSLDLRPAMLDDLGVLPALLWHFERFTELSKVRVVFRHSGLEGQRFSPEVETAVYRIVQEALTNVARHAKVAEVAVRLRAHEKTLDLRIEDRGAGFDPEATLSAAASSGLAGMRERAALLGGRLTVTSTPGSGTRVMAELPLAGRFEKRRKAR